MDDTSADLIISQLLLLDAEDQTKDIKLFINSPGGSITAGVCFLILSLQELILQISVWSFGQSNFSDCICCTAINWFLVLSPIGFGLIGHVTRVKIEPSTI